MGSKHASVANVPTASTTPPTLSDTSISNDAAVKRGMTSINEIVVAGTQCLFSIVAASAAAAAAGDCVNCLGSDRKATWSSSTASFISPTKTWMLRDSFIDLTELDISFKTFDEPKLNLMQTSRRWRFMCSGACNKSEFRVLDDIWSFPIWSGNANLDLWVDATIEGFHAVGTVPHGGSNFEVLAPWMLEAKFAMPRFPSCKIGLWIFRCFGIQDVLISLWPLRVRHLSFNLLILHEVVFH